MTEEQIEKIVETIREIARNPNQSSGNVTKLNFADSVEISISNSERANNLCFVLLDSIETGVTILNKLNFNKIVSIESIQQEFKVDLTKPLFLNVF